VLTDNEKTEFEVAFLPFMDEVNHGEHRVTRRKPATILAEEPLRLHRIPDTAHTFAFGLARTVQENTPMVNSKTPSTRSRAICSRSVPGENLIMVYHGTAGLSEVARYDRARPGIDDDHFPGTGPGARQL
jgi:hypothetical protein